MSPESATPTTKAPTAVEMLSRPARPATNSVPPSRVSSSASLDWLRAKALSRSPKKYANVRTASTASSEMATVMVVSRAEPPNSTPDTIGR